MIASETHHCACAGIPANRRSHRSGRPLGSGRQALSPGLQPSLPAGGHPPCSTLLPLRAKSRPLLPHASTGYRPTTPSCFSKRPAASVQMRKVHILIRLPMTELVGSYSVPLCSDACSRWIADDKNAHTHNLEVRTIWGILRFLFPRTQLSSVRSAHTTLASIVRWLLPRGGCWTRWSPTSRSNWHSDASRSNPTRYVHTTKAPARIASRRGNTETGSSRCGAGYSFPSPESKGLAWACFTSTCTTFFIACTPAASTCGACCPTTRAPHTHTHTPRTPLISPVRFLPLCVALIRYLGLLRSKFIETARNYLVDGATVESGCGSSSVGAVYSNIIFTEVPLRFTTSRRLCSLRHLRGDH